MGRAFVDLQPTHNPFRWVLPLEESLCVGPPGHAFMFGGVGLAAALGAMQGTTGRPVIWATAQYLSYARPPASVDFDVRIAAQGRHTSQARVTAHVGEREILTVNAALGERPDAPRRQWAEAPIVAPPQDCPESERWNPDALDLHSRLETRVAHGPHGRDADAAASPDGRLILWLRPRGGEVVDAGLLAIFADHLPSAVGAALGRHAGGTSLDNTIRLLGVVETEWVLCEASIVAVGGGAAHGAMRLFAQDGTLMASASQSMIVRLREP